MQPFFITLDGIDGAGKTTHLNTIRRWFEARHLPVLFTREPGGTDIGETIRGLLLNPQTQVNVRTETLLMFAARQQHVDDVIRPALAQGTCVVSDRFTDATFAYQGGGRGVPFADIEALEQWVQQDLRPDLTVILDVPLEVSQERLTRGGDKDRFEREEADFFARTRAAYLTRAQSAPQRYVVVDSSGEAGEVSRQIEAALDRLWEQRS